MKRNKLIIIVSVLILVFSLNIVTLSGCSSSAANKVVNNIKENGTKDGDCYSINLSNDVELLIFTSIGNNGNIVLIVGDVLDLYCRVSIPRNLNSNKYEFICEDFNSSSGARIEGKIDPSLVNHIGKGIRVTKDKSCAEHLIKPLTTYAVAAINLALSSLDVYLDIAEVGVTMNDLGFTNFN